MRPEPSTLEGSRRVPPGSLRHSLVSPRWRFDERKTALLAQSIREHGVLQPLLVRPFAERGQTVLEVVIGERRLRAALQAGVPDVPVIVRELSDAEARRAWLVKQLQRAGVNALEETEAIRDALGFELDLSWDRITEIMQRMLGEWQRHRSLERLTSGALGGWELAERVERIVAFFQEVGRISWQGFLTNRVYLLRYPDDVLDAVREGQVSLSSARLVARVRTPEGRERILEALLNGSLSVRGLEACVNRALGREEPSPTAFLERVHALETWLRANPALPDGVLADFDASLARLERHLQ